MAEQTTLKPWTEDIDPDTIPEHILVSQWGKRNARRRQSYTGGVYWKKHNPNTPRCRCKRCMGKREKEAQSQAAE
jgi:hypothetical protein